MTLSRRTFLTTSGAAAFVPVAAPAAPAPPAHAAHAAPAASAPGAEGYRFFMAPEAAFVEAAVDRLIPPDEVGPGATEAGVPHYIDSQLAGAWGAGDRLFRGGPWQAGTPSQGYQLPLTPAEMFRTALRGLREDAQRRNGSAFERWRGPQQDAYLTLLQGGTVDLGGVPSKVFFESLLGLTVEGYFSDPVYGGNRNMAAWRMIGFPGAHGNWYDWVDRHGARYDGEPRSLAQRGDGVVHAMPMQMPQRPAKARR